MTDFSILPILQKIPLFESLSDELHQDIIDSIQMQYFPVDHVLFNEGDQGDKMYIIKTGSVKIFSGEKEIAVLGEGAFFGEMALMGSAPRNASAKVLEEAEIFTLEREVFDALLSRNPEAAEEIKKVFAERYSESQLTD